MKDHNKITIAVTGATDTTPCGDGSMDIAKSLGGAIAKHGAYLAVSDVKGFPLWVAAGAHNETCNIVGFSPASSAREHIDIYRMGDDYIDMMIYTGFGVTGSNLIMTRSADAVIFGCGKVAAAHEFAIAASEKKPIGVLEGDWESDEMIRKLIPAAKLDSRYIVFDKDPVRLVDQIVKMVNELRENA